jgi:translation initiation factor 2 beta subunit (eIF-2beta)/eIF-5
VNKKRTHSYVVFTPAGSMIYETLSKTERAAQRKCMKLGAHMPYGTNWKAWDERGYSVEYVPMTP